MSYEEQQLVQRQLPASVLTATAKEHQEVMAKSKHATLRSSAFCRSSFRPPPPPPRSSSPRFRYLRHARDFPPLIDALHTHSKEETLK